MNPTALAVGCVLVLGLTGCGGSDQPKSAAPTAPPSTLPASVGTVQGTLLMVGGPAPGDSVPTAGKVTIEGESSTVNAEIGKDGTYAIQLPPGLYRISATAPKYGGGTCRTDPPVTVIAAGKTVTADVLCPLK